MTVGIAYVDGPRLARSVYAVADALRVLGDAPLSDTARTMARAVVALRGDSLKIHVHTDTPEAVFSYAKRWGTYHPQDCFVSLATGVPGTHLGPGAWGILYQAEDEL